MPAFCASPLPISKRLDILLFQGLTIRFYHSLIIPHEQAEVRIFATFGPHKSVWCVRGVGLPYRDSSSPPFCVTSIALFVHPTLFTTPPKEQQMRFFEQDLETICTVQRCTFWVAPNERVLHERRHIIRPFKKRNAALSI